jgi:DNA-binding LacI/PurR family transcriptional regulator
VPFFARLASNFEKSTNMIEKKNFFGKNRKRCQKTQNFTLISNPLKKYFFQTLIANAQEKAQKNGKSFLMNVS